MGSGCAVQCSQFLDPKGAGIALENTPENAPDPISQNVESIAAFYKREQLKVGGSQRLVEAISTFVARPVFLGCIVVFVGLWIAVSLGAAALGLPNWDPAPFFWLQGVVSLLSLLATTVVLISQERWAKLEERREHLDLQVNLLTEQKTTKLIHLFEELRRDMPMVKNRHDAESETMQKPTDPHRVLAEIDEARHMAEREFKQGLADTDTTPPQPLPE